MGIWKSCCIALGAVVLAGCSLLPKPPTEPVPPPVDPPYTEECQALLDQGIKWCHEEPTQTCSTEEQPCLHNPSQNPKHCEKAGDCPVELPQPQCPTFTDRGGTLRVLGDACDCYLGEELIECPVEPPVDPPPVGCEPPGPIPSKWGEPALAAAGDPTPQYHDEVKAATDALGDRKHCTPPQNLDSVAAQLSIDLGHQDIIRGIEAVFILRTDNLWEENHTVAFGNSGWTNSGRGRYMGSHRYTAQCPPPYPDMSDMKFMSKEYSWGLDTTLVTVYQPEFCGSIGYCCMPHSPTNDCDDPACTRRGGCPVRGDGDPTRPVCEQELCNQKWECNGSPYPGRNGNPAQTDCRGHYRTWCANSPAVFLEGDR